MKRTNLQKIDRFEELLKLIVSSFRFSFVGGQTSMALTEAITYDNECSCALDTNCTTQAGFLNTGSRDIIPINGLKMGCTPTGSFLASTLECFYNSSCINLIQEHVTLMKRTNLTDAPVLFTKSSQFPPDTLINDMVGRLFVEAWSNNTNYSAYFTLCAPTSCSFTYVQQVNSLYTGTVILGLYGGLNVVLRGICPTLIYLLYKMYQCRKKRSNRVDAEHCGGMATIESASAALPTTDVTNVNVDLKSVPTIAKPGYITLSCFSAVSQSSYRSRRAAVRSALQRSLFVGFVVVIIVATMCVGPLVYLHQ